MIRLILIISGVLLIAFSRYIAYPIDSIAEKAGFKLKDNVTLKAGRGNTVLEGEDDILDNKTKWRIIVAGYIIFALIALFSVISIFTLNNKINTLYNSVQKLESMTGY